jgi:hypothetical protein
LVEKAMCDASAARRVPPSADTPKPNGPYKLFILISL